MSQNRIRKPILVFFILTYFVIIPICYRDSNYILHLIITSSIISISSMGVWLTFRLGFMNIGQAAYCTIGGYVTALLSVKAGLSFWLCLPISALISAIIGILIGIPVLRLKGVYFAMVTICLGEAVKLFFHNWKFSGGPNGVWDIPLPGAISIFGLTLVPQFTATDRLPFYMLAGSLLMCAFLINWRIQACRIGLIFNAVSQSDTLAASTGIDIAKYRIMAYAICCSFGGVSGSFLASYMNSIYPASFTIMDSIYFNLYCFIGGLDYIFGPAVGTFMLTILFEALRGLKSYQAIIYGATMIAAILWFPNGLLSLKYRKETED
jgi:branched-chain amino acid transport system permease protein